MIPVGRDADGSDADDGSVMPSFGRLDDRTADAVLQGRVPVEPGTDPGELPDGLAEVAAFAASIRSAATAAPATPTAALAEVLAEGLVTDGAELPATRSRRTLGAALAKIAAAGAAAKLAAAGAAVAVTAAGAGAAGVLPDGLQGQFDGLRGGDAPPVEVEVEPTDARDGDLPDAGDRATEAEAPGPQQDVRDSFREWIPSEATDGEAGVDGEDVGDRASGESSSEARDRAATESDGRSDLGRDAATERTAPEGAPDAPGEATRPDEADEPDPADDAASRGDERGEDHGEDHGEDGASAPEDAPSDDVDTRTAPSSTPGR